MNAQVNVRFPAKLLGAARSYAKKQGFGTVQEFIKEAVREKLFEPAITGKELALIKKLAILSETRDLYGTEKELFKKLKQ